MAACGLAAETVADWTPPARWRGVNLLGMFRCPTTGLAPDPRVDGHFVEWEFKALREWGFNFARLPLDYRILVKEDSWTNLDERKMKFLDEAVNWGGPKPREGRAPARPKGRDGVPSPSAPSEELGKPERPPATYATANRFLT